MPSFASTSTITLTRWSLEAKWNRCRIWTELTGIASVRERFSAVAASAVAAIFNFSSWRSSNLFASAAVGAASFCATNFSVSSLQVVAFSGSSPHAPGRAVFSLGSNCHPMPLSAATLMESLVNVKPSETSAWQADSTTELSTDASRNLALRPGICEIHDACWDQFLSGEGPRLVKKAMRDLASHKHTEWLSGDHTCRVERQKRCLHRYRHLHGQTARHHTSEEDDAFGDLFMRRFLAVEELSPPHIPSGD